MTYKKVLRVDDSNSTIGWSAEKKGEIDWIAFKGNSEAIQEIKELIHKFKADKDYTYFPNVEVNDLALEKAEKYTIHNSQLKKNLWELTGQEEEMDIPDIPEMLEPLDRPVGLIKPIKPIKPLKPLRPIGKPKENKEWKEYWKEMNQYRKEMDEFCKEIKDYNREIQEYNEEIKDFVQKNMDKMDFKSLIENKKFPTDPEYREKFCPNCGIKKVISTDKYCSECGARLGTVSKNDKLNLEKETKNQWKWREFWIGVSVCLILVGFSLLLIKLFSKKK